MTGPPPAFRVRGRVGSRRQSGRTSCRKRRATAPISSSGDRSALHLITLTPRFYTMSAPSEACCQPLSLPRTTRRAQFSGFLAIRCRRGARRRLRNPPPLLIWLALSIWQRILLRLRVLSLVLAIENSHLDREGGESPRTKGRARGRVVGNRSPRVDRFARLFGGSET